MEFQDVIYLVLLIFSVAIGHHFKRIENLKQRKLAGTTIGLLIIIIVSGPHVLHPIICFATNALIILFAGKSRCHYLSLVFSFAYLLFFRTTYYIGIPSPPSHTNLIQMILTLRMVSLAYDTNELYRMGRRRSSGETSEQTDERKYNHFEVDFVEIFHYAFSYIGVLTGPFIRYRSFRDYYSTPYHRYAPFRDLLVKKLQWLPIIAILFCIGNCYFPFSYAKSVEFFEERSTLYRFFYIWPTFFNFRMRLYIGFILSECACISAGMGAYPSITEPTSGGGPTKHLNFLLENANNEEVLANTMYSFSAVDQIDLFATEFTPTFKEAMRAWNKSVQYWLAVYIYKRCPLRKQRALITMIVSALWHGIYTGHYVCLCGAALVMPLDSLCTKVLLKNKTGLIHNINRGLLLIISRFFFSYLGIAFNYLTFEWVMYYYNSVYHVGLIIGVILYVGGLHLAGLQRRLEQNENKQD